MTKPKPKVIHVVVDPEMHRRIEKCPPVGLVPTSKSQTVRWLLELGLRQVEQAKGRSS